MLICYVSDVSNPGIVSVSGDGSYSYTNTAFLTQDGSLDTAASRNLYYGVAQYGDGTDISCTFSVNTSMMKFAVSAPDGIDIGEEGVTLTYMSGGNEVAKATFTVGNAFENTIYLSIPAGKYSGEQALVYTNGNITITRILSASQAHFTAGQTYSKEVSFSNATCLESLDADYVAQDGEWLSGTLVNNVQVSIASGATVTLKNVSINADGSFEDESPDHAYPGLSCEGDATNVLCNGTFNTVRGIYNECPGVYIPSNHLLTIRGGGTLNATVGPYAAGIGIGNQMVGGNIVIESGTINATGGSTWGAGIGSSGRACGDITIAGGTVTATATQGAGIGTGTALCGTITLSGGTIVATGGYGSAGIGGRNYAITGDVIVTTGITSVTATKGADAPYPIGPGTDGYCNKVRLGFAVAYKNDTWQFPTSGDYGHITFNNNGDTWTLTPASTLYTKTKDISEGDVTVPNGAYWKVTGTIEQTGPGYKRSNRLVVEDGDMVLLSDMSIKGVNTETYKFAGIECSGDAIIVLEGTNSTTCFWNEYPAVHIATGHTLTIRGSGKLTAGDGNSWGAGIGGEMNVNCGNICIEGGTIIAKGGSGSAGIGGGENSACGDITITADVTSVTAVKGEYDVPTSSIGAGYNGVCGTVYIEPGANVTQQ